MSARKCKCVEGEFGWICEVVERGGNLDERFAVMDLSRSLTNDLVVNQVGTVFGFRYCQFEVCNGERKLNFIATASKAVFGITPLKGRFSFTTTLRDCIFSALLIF
nr:unnamed protein product [Callosobruchus chinensis]